MIILSIVFFLKTHSGEFEEWFCYRGLLNVSLTQSKTLLYSPPEAGVEFLTATFHA